MDNDKISSGHESQEQERALNKKKNSYYNFRISKNGLHLV